MRTRPPHRLIRRLAGICLHGLALGVLIFPVTLGLVTLRRNIPHRTASRLAAVILSGLVLTFAAAMIVASCDPQTTFFRVIGDRLPSPFPFLILAPALLAVWVDAASLPPKTPGPSSIARRQATDDPDRKDCPT